MSASPDADGTQIDIDLLEKADEKLRKREYMRNIMRFYREEKREELSVLKAQVVDLRRELKQRVRAMKAALPPSKRSLLLPWKDVAGALEKEREDVESERVALQRRTADLKALVRDMRTWTSVNLTRNAMPTITTTWQNVSLPANPASRQLGKAWITQQMHHNATRAFSAFAFPDMRSSDTFFDVAFEATDARFEYIHRRQYVVDVPMVFMLQAYKKHLCSVLMMDWFGFQENTTLKETSGNTTLHQCLAEDDEWMNLVTGEFPQDDGSCLFVIQQIEDDEAAPTSCRQRNRMIWLDARPLPGERTQVRVLYRFAQYFDSHGYISIDDEAESWDYDVRHLPEEKKEDSFRQFVTARLVSINAKHQPNLNNHLRRMMNASS
ncbi:Aste57867_14225 [Aphanomyces stellatus]|uniref:Aste57867_14225 protein n=1 Tax=Aphanomyces stellatus TaxID=120398 RepID=A0A485L0G0_9STRA|nr:hypothetical protein As57867_014174 [Aphanomyces stellatus]VFT91050.1 Aste57867_14225 [Aphanomyces stellatus]